jgi:hypothetical protein
MSVAINGSGTITGLTATGISAQPVFAGNILQVVNVAYSTEATSSSSTFADTGLTATITPSSSSNKILVLVNQNGCFKSTNDTQIRLRLLRAATNILDFERLAGYTNSVASSGVGSCSLCFLDSPATTSATTYKTQFASANNNAEVRVQINSGGAPSSSTITLLEVAA